ncbi:uncharacterized protein LOC119369647 [Jatropha curcas]|uniref:uncharacterized protein LOC119369647 n=1 Tax=Jatropha curcas TaxID=180498 RepID=UPI0018961EDE|nr:uncharacterized protein LOC119369647 [Jatropha curcas]
MDRLVREILIIICKLEQIFPPGFFDSMEHLLIHLPFEAQRAGSWQYRWMYPFERHLHILKKNVHNKAKVEGSICNAYLVEESSTFVPTTLHPMFTLSINKSHEMMTEEIGWKNLEGNLSIFTYPGRKIG